MCKCYALVCVFLIFIYGEFYNTNNVLLLLLQCKSCEKIETPSQYKSICCLLHLRPHIYVEKQTVNTSFANFKRKFNTYKYCCVLMAK